MVQITDFFHRPAFSRVRSNPTPEKEKKTREPHESFGSPSSPLSDPPPWTIDLTSEDQDAPDAQLNVSLSQSVSENLPPPLAPEQSFENTASAPPPSSLGSFNASQRIVKDGKEVVISSDGEDTDSIGSLEDPELLFAPRPKAGKEDPAATKATTRSDKALFARLSAPKKYKNTLDSLVHDAVDDNEIEANVAKVKATFVQPRPNGEQAAFGGNAGSKKGLHEGMLTSALGDSEDGSGLRRLLDAVRRTEALDQDRVWRFLDQTQMSLTAPKFPKELFAPESHLASLREPETRIRAFQSGILEFASSLQYLPDELVRWLFCSIPLEPRDELRKAYIRVFAHTTAQRVEALIRPNDIDDLFRHLGAKPQALDISASIVEDASEQPSRGSRLKDRAILLSIFDLLRDAADLFADDSRERAIHVMLRITLDTSLTDDSLIRSGLQSALSALLERVPEANTEEMDRRICTTVYDTIKDPQFQSRMLQHILPTSTWISLLRCRLAVAFLLQNPAPLTETPEEVLDLKRLTVFLVRDERFRVKLHKSKGDYNYGELIAIATLLDIVINSSLYDLGYKQADTAKEFDAAIDKLATQIKTIFSSIEDTGASHLKRMLAKEALEALHYRVIYSVRSKPPPKKTLFKTYAKENGDIRSIFKTKVSIDTSEEGTPDTGDGTESTAMPIRGH